MAVSHHLEYLYFSDEICLGQYHLAQVYFSRGQFREPEFRMPRDVLETADYMELQLGRYVELMHIVKVVSL